MVANARYLSYKSTRAFSALVNDYLDKDPALDPFYNYSPDRIGITNAIEGRKNFPVDREKLVHYFQSKYSGIPGKGKVQHNISALLNPGTFTICTAHQPNIFTGHLYFIYKIMHAIRLADELNTEHTNYHFVPVYYMGSEDADLDELGEIEVDGKKYRWQTNQTGAVGRMLVDDAFIKLMESLAAQVSVQPFGTEIIEAIKACYIKGETIAQATFKFVHYLFAEYGLLVLDADDKNFKSSFVPLMEKELSSRFSSKAVAEVIGAFPESYGIQAAGREINLFYLLEDSRERIDIKDELFVLANGSKSWSQAELIEELNLFPERFSPNVILRPLYQETLLPDVVFIGGGGELAYWLELKTLFNEANIFFPVLLLRNSFLLIEKKYHKIIQTLGIEDADLFALDKHFTEWIKKATSNILDLEKQKLQLKETYTESRKLAASIDASLDAHVQNLAVKTLKKIEQLEKKMFRAERKKHEALERQLRKLQGAIFPGGILQERVENLISPYSRRGKDFIREIYTASKGMEMQFCILYEEEN